MHEKDVRHGHISTLHIRPARQPLAASRAALLATLLPDPGHRDERRKLLARMAGRVVEASSASEERMKEKTRGGIFHWGREDGGELARFRAEIREAFGGRAPRVLDPFAGGRAIPLEAMRLGWEAVATDINPVAWFILRCTLHYPNLLSGEARPLSSFALRDRALAAQARRMHKSRVAYRIRMQAITTVSVGRAVPRKSGGQSILGRESVSVKRPCRFAGTQCGGRPARAPRSARESPEGSSEPTRYRRKKPSPWGTKCLYPHSHPGISKTCGQRARLSEGAAPVGDPHRPGRGAGDPFRREGALMAHLHCSGSIAGG